MAGELSHQDLTSRLGEGLSLVVGAFTGQPSTNNIRANMKAGVPLGYIPDHKQGGPIGGGQPMANNNFSNHLHLGQ